MNRDSSLEAEQGNPSSLGHTIPATPPAWLTSNTSAAAAWVWRTQRLTGHASHDWHSNGAPLSLGKSTRTPAHRIRPPHARLPRSRRKATRRELDGLTSGSRLRVGRGRGNKTGRLSFTSRLELFRHSSANRPVTTDGEMSRPAIVRFRPGAARAVRQCSPGPLQVPFRSSERSNEGATAGAAGGFAGTAGAVEMPCRPRNCTVGDAAWRGEANSRHTVLHRRPPAGTTGRVSQGTEQTASSLPIKRPCRRRRGLYLVDFARRRPQLQSADGWRASRASATSQTIGSPCS